MQSSGNLFRQGSLSNRSRKFVFFCFSYPLVFLLTLFFITGCSDDNVKVELAGQIDRSLPAGMMVCLDISGNGTCDANEPSARTNADGTYSVIIPAESLGLFPLVVEPTQKTAPPVIALSAPAGKHDFVSPVSTAVQRRVYQGSSLAEAEAEVRTRYAVPNDVDLYTDYQGGFVNPEPVRTLIEAAEEVATDYGFDVADNEELAEAVADAQRVVVRRVSRASRAVSADTVNEAADSFSVDAASPSVAAVSAVESGSVTTGSTVVAVAAERSISTGKSGTSEKNALSSSADNSDKDSQSDGSNEEEIDKNDSSSKISGSDDSSNNDDNTSGSGTGDPVDNSGNANGSGTGAPVDNSGNSNGFGTDYPGDNSGNSNGSGTGDPGDNNGSSDPSDNFMSISAIQLDVLKIEACADEGGCTVASGPMQLDLLDLADGRVDFANQVLLPERTKELRLILGDNNTITIDGESFPLSVPSGKKTGLKLKGRKAFPEEGGFLLSLELKLDLQKQLIVKREKVKSKGSKKGSSKGSRKGKKSSYAYSYKLKPVIQVKSAVVTPPIFEEEKIPSFVMMVAQGTDKVTLAWVPGSDGKTPVDQIQYEIHFSVEENFIPDSSTLKKTVTGTTQAEVSELAVDTLYYAKIIAHYLTFSGEPSNELQIRTYRNPIQQDLSVTAVEAADLGLGKHTTTDGVTYTYTGGIPPEIGSVLFSEDVAGGMTLRTVDSTVDSVSTSGNTVTVETSDASLIDTLDVGSIYTSFLLFNVATQAGSRMEWNNNLLTAEQINNT
ncbi:MAG: hypothetical protein D3903_09915 [Candidatus Electrothrix sp. GM3_4]|nr:hypothetical protein [Candidatus Electrothrix sp. GM3_4]